MKQYDVIIIGGGPAGLSAALYASRARLSTLLLDKGLTGGQVSTTHWIENYPGFPEGIGGPDLVAAMESQAKRFGTEVAIVHEAISLDPETRRVATSEGEFEGKAIILAMGAEPGLAKLGIPGEEEFRGRGVSYCATCDGAFFREMDVAVIGGGDSAVEEAMFLTRFAKTVTIVHRRDELRATKILQERAKENPKIRFALSCVPTAILGESQVEGLEIEDVKTKERRVLPLKGVFIFIGVAPNSQILKDKIPMDERGYIVTDASMRTSLPGIFAAGDIRQKPLRQVVTAVNDGAIAAVEAEKFIEELKYQEKVKV